MESTPNLDALLHALIEAEAEKDAERAQFCGCEGQPPTRDRVCLICRKPNLVAMIAWRADACTCDPPDNRLHGIELRDCRTCSKPVFEVIERPEKRTFR